MTRLRGYRAARPSSEDARRAFAALGKRPAADLAVTRRRTRSLQAFYPFLIQGYDPRLARDQWPGECDRRGRQSGINPRGGEPSNCAPRELSLELLFVRH
jgi:hypothetical protein